jgi:hypothetical protein
MPLNKLLQRLTGKPTINSVNIVAQRFIQIFQEHGVIAAQIPRLMPQIKLGDLQSEASLLAALTPDILKQTAELLGVSLKWLEGASDKIYEDQSCYKRPELFFELLAGIRNRKSGDDIGIPLQILTSNKHLDGSNTQNQPLLPILVEEIAELDDETIYRYIIFNDGFDWGYLPTRVQLKAMARMLFTRGHTVTPLLEVKSEVLERINEGKPCISRDSFNHAQSGVGLGVD